MKALGEENAKHYKDTVRKNSNPSSALSAEEGWKKYYSDTDILNPTTKRDLEAKIYYQMKEDSHTRNKYPTEEEMRKAARVAAEERLRNKKK